MANEGDYETDGGVMPLYYALPEGDGPFPGIVVMLHIGGLDEFEALVADKLAADGFAAVVPDVFYRHPPQENRGALRALLTDEQILSDINAGVSFLDGTGKVDMDRMGIIGHCMGGRLAIVGAVGNPIFKIAADYYGGNIFVSWGDTEMASPFDRLADFKGSFIGLFGNEDRNPSPEDVDRLEAELNRLGTRNEIHRYDNAGHAFQNTMSEERYRPEATEKSWATMMAFLQRELA